MTRPRGGLALRRILWAISIAAVLLAGFLLVRGLSRLAQQPQALAGQTGPPPGAALRTVRLFFGAESRVDLESEERVIVDPGTPEDLAAAIAREVLRGPVEGVSGLPQSTTVRAFYLSPDGTGYLDLSSELLDRWPRGDGLEWVSLGSLIRSIAENVPSVRAVQLLIEGHVVEDPPGSIPLDLPLDPGLFGARSPELLK